MPCTQRQISEGHAAFGVALNRQDLRGDQKRGEDEKIEGRRRMPDLHSQALDIGTIPDIAISSHRANCRAPRETRPGRATSL